MFTLPASSPPKYRPVERHDQPAKQNDRQNEQQRRPVDARRIDSPQHSAKGAEERVGHTGENVIELLEDAEELAMAPPERALPREKEDPRDHHPGQDQPLEELQNDQNDAEEGIEERQVTLCFRRWRGRRG